MKKTIQFKALFSFVIILLSFTFSNKTIAQSNAAQKTTYIKVEVKGLACPFCAYGLEKMFKEVEGLEVIKINFKEGLAYLSTAEATKPTKEELTKIVKDAGFTPGEISFSQKAFIKKEDE